MRLQKLHYIRIEQHRCDTRSDDNPRPCEVPGLIATFESGKNGWITDLDAPDINRPVHS